MCVCVCVCVCACNCTGCFQTNGREQQQMANPLRHSAGLSILKCSCSVSAIRNRTKEQAKLRGTICSLNSGAAYLLVILYSLLVVAKEIVCVAKVTQCPPLSLLVAQLSHYLQIGSAEGTQEMDF